MKHPASFRDPNGYIFTDKNGLCRCINPVYFPHFDQFEKSGLYKKLVDQKLLIPHELLNRDDKKIIIKPELIPFITYPSEWSFEALKQAALLHLKINILSLEHDMILKDASSYNVQFLGSNPIFIDTLSFEKYIDGKPWYAFGQFCRHFICPLLLIKYCSYEFHKTLINFIDGIPLAFTSSLLPLKTHFSPFIKSNIHIHSKQISRHQGIEETKKEVYLSKKSLMNIFLYMQDYLEKLRCPNYQTEWGDYHTGYESEYFKNKFDIVSDWVESNNFKKIWDLAGNNGHLCRYISNNKSMLISSDIDYACVNECFKESQKANKDHIWSVLLDITNPTPAFGFENQERASFLERIHNLNLDCTLILAFIHHLCISNNCSYEKAAKMFAGFSKYLIIEFIDRGDDRLQMLLDNMRGNKSLFDFYCRENFEKIFSQFFTIIEQKQTKRPYRNLYLMKSLSFQ